MLDTFREFIQILVDVVKDLSMQEVRRRAGSNPGLTESTLRILTP